MLAGAFGQFLEAIPALFYTKNLATPLEYFKSIDNVF